MMMTMIDDDDNAKLQYETIERRRRERESERERKGGREKTAAKSVASYIAIYEGNGY